MPPKSIRQVNELLDDFDGETTSNLSTRSIDSSSNYIHPSEPTSSTNYQSISTTGASWHAHTDIISHDTDRIPRARAVQLAYILSLDESNKSNSFNSNSNANTTTTTTPVDLRHDSNNSYSTGSNIVTTSTASNPFSSFSSISSTSSRASSNVSTSANISTSSMTTPSTTTTTSQKKKTGSSFWDVFNSIKNGTITETSTPALSSTSAATPTTPHVPDQVLQSVYSTTQMGTTQMGIPRRQRQVHPNHHINHNNFDNEYGDMDDMDALDNIDHSMRSSSHQNPLHGFDDDILQIPIHQTHTQSSMQSIDIDDYSHRIRIQDTTRSHTYTTNPQSPLLSSPTDLRDSATSPAVTSKNEKSLNVDTGMSNNPYLQKKQNLTPNMDEDLEIYNAISPIGSTTSSGMNSSLALDTQTPSTLSQSQLQLRPASSNSNSIGFWPNLSKMFRIGTDTSPQTQQGLLNEVSHENGSMKETDLPLSTPPNLSAINTERSNQTSAQNNQRRRFSTQSHVDTNGMSLSVGNSAPSTATSTAVSTPTSLDHLENQNHTHNHNRVPPSPLLSSIPSPLSIFDNIPLEERGKYVPISTRSARFHRMLADPDITLSTLRKAAWKGVPRDCRADVWSILVGYLPIEVGRREQIRRYYSEKYKDLVRVFDRGEKERLQHEQEQQQIQGQGQATDNIENEENEEKIQGKEGTTVKLSSCIVDSDISELNIEHQSMLRRNSLSLSNSNTINLDVDRELDSDILDETKSIYSSNEQKSQHRVNALVSEVLREIQDRYNEEEEQEQQQKQQRKQQRKQLLGACDDDLLEQIQRCRLAKANTITTIRTTSDISNNNNDKGKVDDTSDRPSGKSSTKPLCNNTNTNLSNVRHSDQALRHQITIDVPRTTPTHPIMHAPKIQASLERLLCIWSLENPTSGYVQGINDIATPFFVTFLEKATRYSIEYMNEVASSALCRPTSTKCSIIVPLSMIDCQILLDSLITDDILQFVEANTYWCLSNFMLQFSDNFTISQPGLHRMIYELQEIIQFFDRQLHEYLTENIGIQYIQFAFRWFNCLFLREISLTSVLRLWDSALSEDTTHWNTHIEASTLAMYNIEPYTESDTSRDQEKKKEDPNKENIRNRDREKGTNSSMLGGNSLTSFFVFFGSAILIHFSKKLQTMDFQDSLLFMQNLPINEWSEEDISMLISHVYILQSKYDASAFALQNSNNSDGSIFRHHHQYSVNTNQHNTLN